MVSSIEEYKELRAEIRHYLTNFYTLRRFGFLITIGVLGFGFTQENTYPLFLASGFMVLCLWHEKVRTIRAVFRVATYLETIVEPHQNGLHWESLSSKHHYDLTKGAKVSRMFANLDLPVLFFINTAMGIRKLWPVNHEITVWVSIIFALLFTVVLVGWTYRVISIGKKQEREKWEKVKADLVGQDMPPK